MKGMNHRIRPVLASFTLAVLLLGLSACSSTGQRNDLPASGPALWKASDADTEIIFFGTIHLLPERLDWQRDELKTILDRADQIYLESDTNNITPADQLAFARAGEAGEDAYLSDLLPADEFAALSAMLVRMGADMAFMNSRQPWYASIVLGRLSLEEQGYLTEFGAEAWLNDRADSLGIPVHALENVTDVAIALSGLPQEMQIELLSSSISDTTSVKDDYTAILTSWLAGDTDALYRLTMAEMATTLPDVYNVMLEDRNENWTIEIERVMAEETGTILIAVGSGHLVGPSSLLTLLADKGWDIEQF